MFKKYPFVKQINLKECAVASVMMIIKYYHGSISYMYLSELLKVTKNGVTAYHIVKALNTLGFKAAGIRGQALEKTNIPFIANVIIKNSYKHYIVVYEVSESSVLVADPADKIKRMSKSEFYKIWTGVNIIMRPERPIIRINNNNYLKILKKLITPNIKPIILLALLSLIMTFSGIIGSYFFQSLIDNLNSNNLNVICLFFTTLIFIKIFTNYFRNRILIKFISNLDKVLTKKTFKHIINLPYLYYQNYTTGEIVSKTSDLRLVRDTLSKILLTVFIDFPLTLISGIILFNINKVLFILVLFIVFGYILILLIYKNKINRGISKTLEANTCLNSYMTESISSFETIKGLSLEEKIENKFNDKHNKLLRSKMKLDKIINNQLLLKDIISNIGNILILIVGIYLIKDGCISLSMFITFNIIMSLFLEPVRNIVDLDFELKESIAALKRVLDLYDILENKNNSKITSLTIKNLSYSFDDRNYILKNINLEIKKGEKILISGESGSGKSTLVKILKGYFKNYEGMFLVNGKKVTKNMTKVNYMSQKTNVFTDTFHNNLTLKGCKDLKRIKRMCKIGEIAQKYDLGYYTLLEEDGFNISGGQKQRIALARSLQDFDVLIIDEGFSAVDTNMERKIIKNLFKYYKDKTIIVISHRLDNLDLFNRYIKLENGMITLDEQKEG